MRAAAFLLLGTLATSAYATPAYAQKAAEHLSLGIAAQQQLKPAEALEHYQAAVAADARSYEAYWRGAVAAVEVAQQPGSAAKALPAKAAADSDTEDPDANAPKTLADSMYVLAEAYARRALEIDQKRAEGHFAVAFVLGSRSLVSDPLTRLSMAREIWQESSNAIASDPRQDGAYHILGRWYAEIMRLSDFERGYAVGELGEIAENATWDLALKNLEKAVKLAPTLIYHRLDLARAYLDMKRMDDARAQLDKIDSLPATAIQDSTYKEKAKAWRAELTASPTP